MKQITTINKYQNGNYTVEIKSDGSKIRTYTKKPIPKYPESIDLKITEYCDGNCKYCYEDSNTQGKHANLKIKYFKSLPRGIEIAIGGGNPLSHPRLILFLEQLKKIGIISNLTVNQRHLHSPILKDILKRELIYGLGVSPLADNYHIEKYKYYPHRVVHFIVGVHNIKEILKMKERKMLILGFKNIGRGKNFKTKIKEWERNIQKLLKNKNYSIIAFDNLALEQLKIKDKIDSKIWKEGYMGDDGNFTMFVDFVKGFCSKSSFNTKKKIKLTDVVDNFKEIRIT